LCNKSANDGTNNRTEENSHLLVRLARLGLGIERLRKRTE
jgi:hypothetical protein